VSSIGKSSGNNVEVLEAVDGMEDGINRPLSEVVAQVPIACLLTGDELAARQEVAGDLLDLAQQVRELNNGYAFEYPSTEEWANKLLAFVVEERECCPFFTFELIFEANQGSLWLRIGGSADIKEFIRAERALP